MKLGTLLLKRRKELRYSQEYVANIFGVRQSTYCYWESDKVYPSPNNWYSISQWLGIELIDLVPTSNDQSTFTDLPINDFNKILKDLIEENNKLKSFLNIQ